MIRDAHWCSVSGRSYEEIPKVIHLQNDDNTDCEGEKTGDGLDTLGSGAGRWWCTGRSSSAGSLGGRGTSGRSAGRSSRARRTAGSARRASGRGSGRGDGHHRAGRRRSTGSSDAVSDQASSATGCLDGLDGALDDELGGVVDDAGVLVVDDLERVVGALGDVRGHVVGVCALVGDVAGQGGDGLQVAVGALGQVDGDGALGERAPGEGLRLASGEQVVGLGHVEAVGGRAGCC